MAHIDTLSVYREYLTAGYTDTQSEAAVRALNASFDGVATKDDLTNAIEKLEKHLKIFFSYLVGGTLLIAYIIPITIAIVLRVCGIM